MEYTLKVFTSDEKRMANYKADRPGHEIKSIVNNKLPAIYKKYFDKAVKEYDERAISGKNIGRYYDAIVSSNIPEVYELSLIVKYDLASKSDVESIKKIFENYRKALEKEEYMGIVSVFYSDMDEFKEMSIFFVPVSSGYVTGLSVRNDLIDIARRLSGKEDKRLDILTAMPLFVEEMDRIFQTVNNGEILSQQEVLQLKKNKYVKDPLKVHQIEVDSLKKQMNDLQEINIQNQDLEQRVQTEKARIQHDIAWVKETEEKIQIAEKERIRDEILKEQERKRIEAEKAAQDAQRKEEERLRKEEERLKQQRYAEQARRNLEMQQEMNIENILQPRTATRITWKGDDLANAIKKHKEWEAEMRLLHEHVSELSDEELKDSRRLIMKKIDMENIEFNRPMPLWGVVIEDCILTSCGIQLHMKDSEVNGLVCNDTSIQYSHCINCKLSGIKAEDTTINEIVIENTSVEDCDFENSSLIRIASTEGTQYLKCDFENAIFNECDSKTILYKECNLNGVEFRNSDMRSCIIAQCQSQRVINNNSNFRMAQRQ